MRSNTEIRNLAWKRLWTDHWFGRLFGGGLLLGLCGYAIQVVLGGLLGRFGVQDWMTYLQLVAQHRMDAKTPVPNLTPDFISQTSSATVLTTFFSFIMAGIVSYGCAVILKRCLANEENDWLGSAFGGFKDPFGMLWLFLRLVLIYLGWMLLPALPLGAIVAACLPLMRPMYEIYPITACTVAAFAVVVTMVVFFAVYAVPFYRYRFVWLVKAEHPEWSAGECLRSCRALTDGHKLESFRLDCSYWKSLTLMLLPLLTAALLAAVFSIAGFDSKSPLVFVGAFVLLLCIVAMIPLMIIVPIYVSVGQGFLYQELKENKSTEERN